METEIVNRLQRDLCYYKDMKNKHEIFYTFAFVLIAYGFLSVVWLKQKGVDSTDYVAVHEDGTIRGESDVFVADPMQKLTSLPERPNEKSWGARIYSSLGLKPYNDEDVDIAVQEPEENPGGVAVAHGVPADVSDDFGIKTFLKKWKKQEEEDEEEAIAEEDRKQEAEEADRVVVSVEISEGLKKPYYPREDDEEENLIARDILLENANRDSTFGEIVEITVNAPEQITIYADDAHQKRMLDELKSLQIWGGQNKFIFSEIGITDDDDDESYIALAHKFFEAANPMGYSATGWAIGDWWGGYGGSLSQNSQISAQGVSAPFVENVSTDRYVRGLNLAGGEFGMDPDGNGAIGAIGDQYTYHINSGLWKAMRDRGFTHVRFPFRLERLFNADGSFNASDKDLFVQAIGYARANNMKILLDPHNYGAMKINGRQEILGQGVFSLILYNTIMGNLAELANENRDVIDMIGLMNEPKNVNPADWEEYAQSALDEIRGRGFDGVIEVPTGNWQGIQDVPRIHPGGPWIIDPQNNFMYGVHQYFDENHSGHYQKTYAEDEAELLKWYTPGPVSVWSYGNVPLEAEEYPCPPETDVDGDGWGWDGQKGCRV